MNLKDLKYDLENADRYIGYALGECPYGAEDCHYSMTMARHYINAAYDEFDDVEIVEEENYYDQRSVWFKMPKDLRRFKKGTLYLVMTDKHWITVAQWKGKAEGFHSFKKVENVTHWAYIPLKSTAK